MANETAAKKINMIQALNMALHDAMAADGSVIVFGEDVADPEEGGIVGVTKGLSSAFGELRCRSTPIAEQAIVGAAIGASIVGMKPVAEIMLMNFTTVAMDMIVNHAAKLRFMSGGQTHVPLVIRTATGAGLSVGGQHADYYEAWFAHTPGIKVVMPSSPADAYGLLRSAIDDPDPVIFVENTLLYFAPGLPPEAGSRVPLGVAKLLRPGADATLVCYGSHVAPSLAAAESLAGDGISVEVIDLRTISPWDKKTVLDSVARTGRAVITHEAVKPFGVGAEISSVIHEELFSQLKAPVQRVGAPYCPVPYSKPLEVAFMQGADAIKAAVRKTLASRAAA